MLPPNAWYQQWLAEYYKNIGSIIQGIFAPSLCELTYEEALRFADMEPISMDDVLDMHLALREE